MSQLEIEKQNRLEIRGGQLSRMAKRRKRRQWCDRVFVGLSVVVAIACVSVLGVLLYRIAMQGSEYLSFSFLENLPSRFAKKAGMYTAIIGSLWIVVVCAIFAVPLGICTAIWLEEYGAKSRLGKKVRAFVAMNISNLAGVPSIVYGLLGLTVFVYGLGLLGDLDNADLVFGWEDSIFFIRFPFGKSVLSSGLTLGLVVLPVIITSSQEALRAVPNAIRQGALALGATRWQMVWRTTLPMATPGMMTGTILGLSRAIGEAAPILIVGASLYANFVPEHLMDRHSAMPLQIYGWTGKPQAAFHQVAASGIIVLLAILLSINAVAIFIRIKFEKASRS